MGRAVLKSLKESTLLTFFQICKEWNISEKFKYNQMEGVIRWDNGSAVYLKDLFAYPSDPEFDSLGSTEFTGAFIDESSQITEKAKNIVSSRLRYKLEEFKLIPKLFIASNPSKNFLYYDFYKPWKDGTLPDYRKFIVALVQDNPFISPFYIENLKKLDKVSKQRLLYGNFEYDDDPAKLFEYDDIIRIFKNPSQVCGKKYLSVDVARFGNDKTIICLWDGLHMEKVFSFTKKSTAETIDEIKRLSSKHNIPIDSVVVDEDGIGGGVVDQLPGVTGFVNNSRPIEENKVKAGEPTLHNFGNLKAQCYFKLAELLRNNQLSCTEDLEPWMKEHLIEDLEQAKWKDPDKDGRIYLIPKDKVKELIGRSPDIGDAVMMRMIWEVRSKRGSFFFA